MRLEPGTTKNNEGRVFPFDALPELEALLREQRDTTHRWEREQGAICPWVFHRKGKLIVDFYDAWRKACGAIGRPGLCLHDLRRCAARSLSRAGVPERVAMKLMGHKTRSMFDRYNIVNEADLREGVRKLAARRDESGARGYRKPEVATDRDEVELALTVSFGYTPTPLRNTCQATAAP